VKEKRRSHWRRKKIIAKPPPFCVGMALKSGVSSREK
jgi:hypothetical protein